VPGDPLSAVSAATGKTISGVADVAKAKIAAQASVQVAKIAAGASKYNTSVNEADEILSVLDRPCIRINCPDPDFAITMDLSILSLMGGLAIFDLYKGYQSLWASGSLATETAQANTSEVIALAGTVPVDPRALAIMSGVISEPPTPPPWYAEFVTKALGWKPDITL